VAAIDANSRRWLNLLAWAEGTDPNRSGGGYDVLFGGKRFTDFSRHPDAVQRTPGYASAAAGRYQFMPGTYGPIAQRLGLRDFGPASQDLAALALMREAGVEPSRDPVNAQTIAKLAPKWASLPTTSGKSYYGQPVKPLSDLLKVANAPFGSQQSVGTLPADGTQATAVAPTPITLPKFDFKGAIQQSMLSFLPKITEAVAGDNPLAQQYKQKAEELAQAGDEDFAEEYARLARGVELESGPEQYVQGALQNIINVSRQGQKYNADVAAMEGQLNSAMQDMASMYNQAVGALPAGSPGAPAGALKGPTMALPGTVVTSAADASGEPGLDFVIPGGRGAWFKAPFKAQVVGVKGGQNWETNLEKNPGGPRGYGNYVDLRVEGPVGTFDVRLAHFDKLNPGLRPGVVIGPGTPIGTQGRTGSTTGAHVSMDLYDPGKTSTRPEVLSLRNQIAKNLASGRPLW
jgi:muramidase (phage lysozyme)